MRVLLRFWQLSAWQKFHISKKLETSYGHPRIEEQLAQQQWINEWSHQWDDLVEASTYDATGFDDDDDVDATANAPNTSVKDAVVRSRILFWTKLAVQASLRVVVSYGWECVNVT